MSLDAAQNLAERLLEADFVEVYGHHDADGIAAASIIGHALHRAGVRFSVSIRSRIVPSEIGRAEQALLCDMGSSLSDLSEEVMVIDHHMPVFEGPFHVNPRLDGIDGEQDLCGSALAFLVAAEMGDNRDLCGLALVGMIGDRQPCAGKNHEIISEGIANGYLKVRKSLRLSGSTMQERLSTALYPYLKGVSGDEAVSKRLVENATQDGEIDMGLLLSGVILESAPNASADALYNIYGDCYGLEKEATHDACDLVSLLEACGQAGKGGLGVALCLRSHDVIDEAWQTALTYRKAVIHAVQTASRPDEHLPLWTVEDKTNVSGVADALTDDGLNKGPVFVAALADDCWHLSGRAPSSWDQNLAELFSVLAAQCGGIGGGHRLRAGLKVPADKFGCLRDGIAEVVA